MPAACMFCGAATEDTSGLCAGCKADLPWIPHACERCAAPVTEGGRCCARCQRRPPPFASAVAPLAFEGPVRRLLHRFKFESDLAAGTTLGELLCARLVPQAASDRVDALVAVPLSSARLRERGFNQASLLARQVARRTGLVEMRGVCRRLGDRVPQSSLPGTGRRANVRGVFSVAARRLPAAARRIAIVDDVVTTGATASELARVLLAHGMERVELWAPTRARQASRLATDSALVSMKSRRGST